MYIRLYVCMFVYVYTHIYSPQQVRVFCVFDCSRAASVHVNSATACRILDQIPLKKKKQIACKKKSCRMLDPNALPASI